MVIYLVENDQNKNAEVDLEEDSIERGATKSRGEEDITGSALKHRAELIHDITRESQGHYFDLTVILRAKHYKAGGTALRMAHGRSL